MILLVGMDGWATTQQHSACLKYAAAIDQEGTRRFGKDAYRGSLCPARFDMTHLVVLSTWWQFKRGRNIHMSTRGGIDLPTEVLLLIGGLDPSLVCEYLRHDYLPSI
jgi:hypothetical protein